MLRYFALGLIGLVLAGNAWAQQAAPQAEPQGSSSPPPASIEAPKAASMEEPLPGDHWTYSIQDEITGTPGATRTMVITEVTKGEISTRIDTLGKSNPGQIVFDRSWNVLISGAWKYSPTDGSGIQLPLSIGKTWNFRSTYVNSDKGATWKRTGRSKVVGQETVTTKAGTFETFKIEITSSSKNAKDPTQKVEATSLVWYAPTIDHWVKQTIVSRTNNRLMINNTIELIDCGRKA